jgi:O-antigen/teichoic acid export membrane protein
MSSGTLKQKAVSGTLWSGVDAFARQGMQFVVSLILARLLTPQDFGTVALLAIFIALAGVFIDSGFSSALIQRKEITDVDLSSVFYFNIGIALLVASLLCIAAPWIAAFYGMPVLKPLIWLLSVNLVIGSLGSIQSLLLTKALNFRRQCLISLSAQVISGVVAVMLAWRGFGVWSLGIQTVLATIIGTLLLWVTGTWRPRWVFSFTAIRSLFRFGSFLLFSALLDAVASRLNSLVIGKFYSAKDLGYYSRADNTSMIPGSLISSIIGRVAFPLFAAAKDDKAMLQSGLRKSIAMTMMVNIPVMLGMVVTAPSLVVVLFGNQWLHCVPYLQILSLAGILWPLHVLNLNVLMAQGHSNLFFRLELIKKTLGILFISIAAFFGILAIAWSSVALGIIGFCINAYYSSRLVNYGAARQTADLLPYFGAAVVMAACCWLLEFIPLGPFWLLTMQVAIGGVVYGAICTVSRLTAFVEAWRLVQPVLIRRLAWAKV